MRKVREENETLKLTLRIKQAIGILLFVPLIAFGQGVTPPPPMPMNAQLRQQLGAQHPYISLSTAQFTQTVTRVYSEGTMTTNGLIFTETNFVPVKTNTLSVSTNNAFSNPE